MWHTLRLFLLLDVLMLAAPDPASAYVGPGAGITAIGAAVAVVAGVVLGLIGFIWYPLKRLMRVFSKKTVASASIDDG